MTGNDHAFRKSEREPDQFPAGSSLPHLDSAVSDGAVPRTHFAPGRRGLDPLSGRRTARGSGHPTAASRVSERPGRLPGLAPYHALRQLPFHYPAPPQRTIHSDGPSSTLLERSLHARIGVDAIHPSRGPHESSLYGEGTTPVTFRPGSLCPATDIPLVRPGTGTCFVPCSGSSTGWLSWCCSSATTSGRA